MIASLSQCRHHENAASNALAKAGAGENFADRLRNVGRDFRAGRVRRHEAEGVGTFVIFICLM